MGNKIVKTLTSMIAGAAISTVIQEKTLGKLRRDAMRRIEDDDEKFHEFYYLLLQWVHLHNEGKKLGDYLKRLGYNTVAIYGMKEIGEELLFDLQNSDIIVKYAIDRDADNIFVETDVYRPDDELLPVDCIIVTAIHWFDDIEYAMKKKMDCPILALDDLLYEAS